MYFGKVFPHGSVTMVISVYRDQRAYSFACGGTEGPRFDLLLGTCLDTFEYGK